MEKSHDSIFFDSEDSNRITLVNNTADTNRATFINDTEGSNHGSLLKESNGSKSARGSEFSYSEKGSKGKEGVIEEEKLIDEKPPPGYAAVEAKEETVTHIERADSSNTEPLKTPLSRRRRVNNHLRRRWYFYLPGIVVFLAIFLPIL
jgi:hypothetical protein